MRNLNLTRRTDLSPLILLICLVICLLTANVKATGSFELQVVAVKMPDECQCRGSRVSPSFSTSSEKVSTSDSRGNTKKTPSFLNVNKSTQNTSGTPRKDKGNTHSNYKPKAGSINLRDALESSTIHQETGINNKTRGEGKTSSASDNPSPINITDINSTFGGEIWSNNSFVTCGTIQLTVTACLAHHQLRPSKNLKCTYGQTTSHRTVTAVAKSDASSMLVMTFQDPLLLSIPFSYAWPGAFTLRVVTGWTCGNQTKQETTTYIEDSMKPSVEWVKVSSEASPNIFSNLASQNHGALSKPQRDYSASKHRQRRSNYKLRNVNRRNNRRRRSIHPCFSCNLHHSAKAKKQQTAFKDVVKGISKLKSTTKFSFMAPVLDSVSVEPSEINSYVQQTDFGAGNRARHAVKLPRKYTTSFSRIKLMKELSATSNDKSTGGNRKTANKKRRRMRRNIRNFGNLSLSMRSDRIPNSSKPKLLVLEESVDGNLILAVRVVCSDNYYGENCTRFCRARDDYLGHFTCTATGQQVCKDGWQGLECSQAICSSRCMATRATCPAPYTCVCLPGWRGQHCDLCTPRPGCQHGTCSLPGQCACSHGWTGPLCDIEKEFCDLYQPCKNGGSCTHLGQHKYACACSTGYNGSHCEIPVCYVGFCHNEGTCSVSQGERTCQCPAPYSGFRCQLTLEDQGANSSASTPSLALLLTALSPQSPSSSTSNTSGLGMNCIENNCSSLSTESPNSIFSTPSSRGSILSSRLLIAPSQNSSPSSRDTTCFGEVCDRNVKSEKYVDQASSSCQTLHCYNEGTCRESHGKTKAMCVCPEPFLGTQCLQRRSPDSPSPCSSSPCLFGGECFNIVQTTGASSSDGFSCKCLDGFSGDRCELDISIDTSLCAPSPCRNGGTCVEYDGEFLCVCADGFRGSLCQRRRKNRRVTRLKVKILTKVYSPSPSPSPPSSSGASAAILTTVHSVYETSSGLTLVQFLLERTLCAAIPVIIAFVCT